MKLNLSPVTVFSITEPILIASNALRFVHKRCQSKERRRIAFGKFRTTRMPWDGNPELQIGQRPVLPNYQRALLGPDFENSEEIALHRYAHEGYSIPLFGMRFNATMP